jgi:dihydrofolate reductase
MGKVLYHVTMSLDGFITGPGEDMTWLADYVGPNSTVDEILPRIGAALIGGGTYRPGPGGAYGDAWRGPQFVLTRRVPDTPDPRFTFLTCDVPEAVATAKEAAGEKYVAILGATTARRCLDADLLDEVLVHLAPLLLGDGVRLFDRPGGKPVRLERLSQTASSRVTDLWFRVAR